MTTAVAEDKELKESLAKFETAILTPVVSGELKEWVRMATMACNEARNQLQSYRQAALNPQCAVIKEADPDLWPKIQQLTLEDDAIAQALADFRDNLASLAHRAAEVETHESKANNQRETVEAQGLALVLRIRKQLAAADTWFSESLLRDRGTGD